MREWLRRARFFLHHRQLQTELTEEIDFHRAMKERELEARGLSPAESRLAARLALGNDLLARDRARDVWIAPWIQDLFADVRFAARLLAKDRGFTFVAVAALGLGIGVNNTLFSILNAYCIRGLPIDQPDRVVYMATIDKAGRTRGISYPEFEDLRTARTLSERAAFAAAPVALRDNDRAAERVQGLYISAPGLRLLGEAPVVGRDFRPEDDRPGAPPVVILGSGVWKTRYASDPGVVGRVVIINGVPSTVIGVMRDRFAFPSNTDLWQPLALMRGLAAQGRDNRTLGVFGRLTDNATVAEARAEIEGIGGRMANHDPATTESIRFTTVPINERYLPPLTHPAWLAFGTAGMLVLLISCANVANLLLGRSIRRAREIAIRAALGASRRRVVRQLLVESGLLALCGGVVGFALSLVGLRLMASAVPESATPYWLEFTMDGFAFAVLAAVCLGTVLVFGLVPALHISKPNPNNALKEGGRAGTGGVRATWWITAFLTAEVALTMILLSALNENFEGYFKRRQADRVIDPSHLLTMMLTLPAETYPAAAHRTAFYDRLGQRLAGVPALSETATASALPLSTVQMRDVEIENGAAQEGQAAPSARSVTISETYFSTLRLPLVAGRAFTAADGRMGQLSAIVNQRFASSYFSDKTPIGTRIRFAATNTADPPPPWLTIVGVSPVVRQSSDIDPEPVIYLPFRAEPPATAALIVRAPSDAASVAPVLREELRALDPDLPVYRVLTMERAIAETTWNPRLAGWMISIITVIAVCLAMIGLYAVTAHGVAQRTQEIGVRMALGAAPGKVQRLVLRRAMSQLAVGLISGTACTYVWNRLFGSDGRTDPTDVATVAAVLLVVATAACLAPARRAMRVDPVIALRYE